MRAIRPSALFATFLVLPVLGFALLACSANSPAEPAAHVATAPPQPTMAPLPRATLFVPEPLPTPAGP